MHRIFQFLFKHKAFFLFLILEVISLFLVFRVNYYHGSWFFNSSNVAIARFFEASENIYSYFNLVESNEILAEENARLKETLINGNDYIEKRLKPEKIFSEDSLETYEIFDSKVISNSIHQLNNFITINSGSDQGVRQGMGVLGPNGVVGITRNTSSGYSVLYSLLNSKVIISARLESTGDIATIQWDGTDFRYSKLLYLPRHVNVKKGDKVVTSGFNSVFPEKIAIGTVEEVSLPEGATFYDVKIKLATNFSKLEYVYLIDNLHKNEIDSVEANLILPQE